MGIQHWGLYATLNYILPQSAACTLDTAVIGFLSAENLIRQFFFETMAHKMRRRDFCKNTLLAAAGLTVIPRHVLGGAGYTPPSDQITKAIIGVGGIGSSYHFEQEGRLVAVCDVDRVHLENALALAGKGVRGYSDFRELLLARDIDVVHIATPPHWHGLMSVLAAEAGKDIWCEKPMTRTIGEGKRVVEAVEKHGRMFRLNTWFRFKDEFYGFGTPVKPLKKLAASGILGWPLKVTVSGVTGFDW